MFNTLTNNTKYDFEKIKHKIPLTAEMLENSGQIIISKPQIGMKYSVNNGTVVQIESSENDVIINLNFGDIVSFLGEG